MDQLKIEQFFYIKYLCSQKLYAIQLITNEFTHTSKLADCS